MAKKSAGKKKPRPAASKARSSKSRLVKGKASSSASIKKKPRKKPKPLHINAGKIKAAARQMKQAAITGKGSQKGKSGNAPTAKGKKGRGEADAPVVLVPDAKGYVFVNGRRVRMISTKGQPPIKKIRSNGSATDTETQAAETARIRGVKTKLSRKELNHYRDLLLNKRRELVGDLNAMETEALRSGGGNLSHMPIHMADIGTDTFDQDFMLGLAANERDQLREIDAALYRIGDRTFGICQMTGQAIPKARLDAKPWAKYTIEAARMAESQSGR